MERTYIMTIRDLTNEARELNVQTIAVKEFEEEVKKEIEVMAENHISAIASYLNHQLDEVAKFTEHFNVEIYDFNLDERISLWIEKRKEGMRYIIKIKPWGYSAENFITNDYGGRSYERKLSEITSIYIETLIKNWDKLKRQLQYNIQVKITTIQKENEEKQVRLQEKLALYENFEI